MSLKLQEGEQILFEGTPEKRILKMWIITKVIPACFYVAFITFWLTIFFGGIFSCGIKGQEEPPFYLLWPLLTFLVPAAFIVVMFYYKALRETFRYYITNQRCIFEGGIMVRRKRNVPYHKITDVEVNQNILDRILDIYSLKVFTAGTSSIGMPGFEKAEIIFYGLKDAESPAQVISEILKKYKATGE